ncbi:MAG: 50S ribosomal protein L28 [bacterium]
MSRTCEKCGKDGLVVQWRSHSNVATRHRQQVNLQSKVIDGKKTKICAKCIKGLAKVKA